MESPGCNQKSESDSGREETPSAESRVARKSNPHSVINLVGTSSSRISSNSPGSQRGISRELGSREMGNRENPHPNVSAFSNPSLHSAAVHHRNLQAAAAQAMQFQQMIPGFQFPLVHSLISQQLNSQQLNPLNLHPHYNPLLQHRHNPMSKSFFF